ncbi:diguanylate cyclase domain-containing protein [Bacillus sp. EB600]|uniref:diguanylate cyclase domain-containing protein n=1 Tax=Bacillus sp. EB600 TaxID=2806345 RepID=UPI002109B39A|nr:diguanylate cyclase [Bacillus sp. EB600]MCQ6282177.1 diguanylate cyclase [Bacillus sp. EB600]
MEKSILKGDYQNVKVLYVEDDKFSREKLLRILNRRFADVHGAKCAEEGYKIFNDYHPDVVIIDSKMDKIDGFEMIEKIRKQDEKVQIIVITACEDSEFFLQLIENNVNHFILKPIDLEKLLLAIQKSAAHIELERNFEKQRKVTNELILELEKEFQKNELLGTLDPLTKICNRLKFDKILTTEIEQAEQNGRSFSIIIAEIDHFKRVNDHFGYHVGDEMLITLATIVQQRISENDIFARWGGKEFILLIPDEGKQDAAILAESMRTLIEGFYFHEAGKITCSFGIAEFSSGKSKNQLLKDVEHALHLSKMNEKNRVTLYDEHEMRDEAGVSVD